MTRLQDFETELFYNVMLGHTTPKITDTDGGTPIVACLDSEPLHVLVDRVQACGGSATIYSLADDGAVRVLAVLRTDCALENAPTDMVTEPPSKNAPIGMFIDYVLTQKNGVILAPELAGACVRSYGQAQLVNA